MVLPSCVNGYPKSMRALTLTSRAGILVLPFFGYSLLVVVVVVVSSLPEEVTLEARDLLLL